MVVRRNIFDVKKVRDTKANHGKNINTVEKTQTSVSIVPELKYISSNDKKLKSLNILITQDILNNTDCIKNHIYNYFYQMSDMEIKAYTIATTQLHDSFDVVKSIGYNEYISSISSV
jgi:hypothetical protein